ncbi:hypothetical protein TNCT_699611 [Trichonephila clavata]|uniref:Uncharacterized protein n=1 Tax=Trichonephila clavata TaxID=2740835 RepID=A0A8X6F2I5_TRICU|nr:hypothetical protein TNCT_699611 [Trichonephila clavata]
MRPLKSHSMSWTSAEISGEFISRCFYSGWNFESFGKIGRRRNVYGNTLKVREESGAFLSLKMPSSHIWIRNDDDWNVLGGVKNVEFRLRWRKSPFAVLISINVPMISYKLICLMEFILFIDLLVFV